VAIKRLILYEGIKREVDLVLQDLKLPLVKDI